MIHERFCCNREQAALAREASFVKREAQSAKEPIAYGLWRDEAGSLWLMACGTDQDNELPMS